MVNTHGVYTWCIRIVLGGLLSLCDSTPANYMNLHIFLELFVIICYTLLRINDSFTKREVKG